MAESAGLGQLELESGLKAGCDRLLLAKLNGAGLVVFSGRKTQRGPETVESPNRLSPSVGAKF
jgi:hypothetical protein